MFLLGASGGMNGFRSITGVASNASILSTVSTFFSTARILHTVKAIKFGRTGARQAKTPVSGFSLSPRG